MNKKNDSIENFLQSVCRFISTEERAQDIRNELRDHIDSYIDEYTNDGMTIEDSTLKALNQMGDPHALSKSLKDNISSHKNVFIVGLIISFMLILLSIIIYGYIANTCTFIDLFIATIFLISCIPFITLLIKTCKKSNKLCKIDPVFYIQSCKESAWYENLLKPIKWLFIISFLTTAASYLTDFKNISQNEISHETLDTVRLLAMDLTMIIIFSCQSPKVQNNIVYPDGILTFEAFIPWDSIAGYRWVKEHSKNKAIYSIELKFKKKNSSKYSFGSKIIKANSYQINLIDEIFNTHNIEQRQFF